MKTTTFFLNLKKNDSPSYWHALMGYITVALSLIAEYEKYKVTEYFHYCWELLHLWEHTILIITQIIWKGCIG